jgi:hypothetical protein
MVVVTVGRTRNVTAMAASLFFIATRAAQSKSGTAVVLSSIQFRFQPLEKQPA